MPKFRALQTTQYLDTIVNAGFEGDWPDSAMLSADTWEAVNPKDKAAAAMLVEGGSTNVNVQLAEQPAD
jgi:hypothetical protein